MLIEPQISMSLTLIGLLVPSLGWVSLRRWYFKLVSQAQQQVTQANGQTVPMQPLRFLLGHLGEVYGAENRLAAYHRFHEKDGEIVQIFWLWRQQISLTNLDSIRHILVNRQQNYRKFPPNRLIQRLYGRSVLTNHGRIWQRQRTLIQGIFAPRQIKVFHPIFASCTERLVAHWSAQLGNVGAQSRHDVYPALITLFLETISQAALGTEVGAIQGKMDSFLASIGFIVEQSTHPLHQFVPWWHRLPLPKNRRLKQAFETVDEFLYGLIRERREGLSQGVPSNTLLDQLIMSASAEQSHSPLSDHEVRDNLLAILINGYETVATSVAFSLDFLARYPKVQKQVQQEVDLLFSQASHEVSQLVTLPHLGRVIVESLRLRPPMAGLQRISLDEDGLGPWSIPSAQAIGIPLVPVHYNPQHYGEDPAQFRPERYTPSSPHSHQKSTCPIKQFLGRGSLHSIEPPLSFGDGARRCLGTTFALHEMAIALGILLHHFEFSIQSDEGAEMELGKFGLFISMHPKQGVYLTLRQRNAENQPVETHV